MVDREQILGELRETVFPRLLRPSHAVDVSLSPLALTRKSLDFDIHVPDRAWRLHTLLSDDTEALALSLPASLRSLTHTTVLRAASDPGGSLRGPIDISDTVIQRMRRGG